MANVIESKQRTMNSQTKICHKCGSEKVLSEFYSNRNWEQEELVDAWCKDCVNECKTLNDIKRYFFDNNRVWDDRIWTMAQRKAEKLANSNASYTKLDDSKKAVAIERLTCQQVPTCMTSFYKYEDHTNQEYIEETSDDATPNVKKWNAEWYGNFTKRELEFLNSRYKEIIAGKEIDSTTEGYIRKICKQDLLCNKLSDDFAAGKCEYSVVRDAHNIYDMLNKSANLAACKRKEDNDTATLSFSEIAKYLEEHDYPMTRKIEWPPDDVDRVIAEFSYTVTEAIGEES